ncbi:TetR/AcrR family transcriptional regulator [Leucobacter sp. UCMA 4100]|uniref:TetR/AcrR family transcriptional regulator n=1 Tax=Leucobacter sp. UCMA 4100 TaxID=2810534 RepID=UPI0022EAE878|nr:TetR/AcrR family transcriptional regulator [Leucobacter sp. UCMA 4100]MDA3146977.1 TetR/AcrR family transcriptional regulator [Leucobacter sp. UCMA 4100]
MNTGESRGDTGVASAGQAAATEGPRAGQSAPRARVHTRAALIDAAEAIFAARGVPSASIDEICKRAGFTRGAFYSNFKTVDDVFFALYERKTEEVLSGMASFDQAIPAAARGREAVLEAAADEMLRVIPADTQWYALRALFGLRAWSDPDMAEVLKGHGEAFQRQVVPVLEGVARAVGAALVPDADEATRIVIACHVGSVLQGPFVDSPPRLRRDAILTALRGVLTGPQPAH